MTTLTVTANSPVAGSIAWSAFQFSYLGVTYTVAGGNTTLLFSYFIYANRTNYVASTVDSVSGATTSATANATLVSSTTLPAVFTDDDCLWFTNRGGIPLNVQRTDIIDGSLIVTQSIVGTSIAARTIDATNIKANTLTAAEIKASTITTDVLNISTYPPSTIPNGGMEDFNSVTFVPTTWTPGWASAGAVATYSQTGAATAAFGSTSTVMAVPANSVEGLASAAAACDATSYLSGRKLAIQVEFRTTVAAAPVSVRVYWGTTPTFNTVSGLSASTGTVPTVVEIINVNASTASATAFASPAPTPSAAAGVTSLLDYWTGALANNTYLMTGQVSIPQGATWFRVVVSGGRSTYATAASYTWDAVLSQAVMYSTYIGDGVITTRVVAADAITANQIGIIGQRDPVTFQPVNGTNRVEIEPGGIYVYKRSAAGVDTMQAAVDNTTGAFMAGQLVTTGSGTGVVPGFVNSSGRVILDSTGLKGIYRDNTGVDTLKLNFDAVTGNVTVAGAIQSGGTITGSLIRSGVAANSTSRTELDSAGLRLINRDSGGVDTTVVNINATGVVGSISIVGGALTTPIITTPVVSNGTLTGSVVQTSTTVGDGSAASAGVRLNSTGLKGFPANSATPNTTIDTNTGVLTAFGATFTGTITGGLVRTAVPAASTNRVEIDSAGLRLIQRNASSIDTTVGELRTSDGAITFTNAMISAGGTFYGSLSGATGTFSGSLSAATGTFSGNLSAAGGSFAGSLSAVTGSLGALALTDQLTITGAGNINVGGGAFTVSSAGAVTATNIFINGTSTFDGTINATSGSFSGPITSTAVITGGTLQTSLTNPRVVITAASADRIIFYDASGNQTFIQSSAGQLLMLAGNGAYGFVVFGTGECGITGTNIALHGTTQIDAGKSLYLQNGQVNVTAAAGSYGVTTTANIQAQGGTLVLADGSISKTSGNAFSMNSSLTISGGVFTIADGTITKSAGVPFIFNSTARLALIAQGANFVTYNANKDLCVGPLVTSLRAYKRDIVDLDRRNDLVLSLRPVNYFYKDEFLREEDGEHLQAGFIAEEVQELGLEEVLMYGDGDDLLGVHYDRITALLVPIIRDLRDEVAHLRELVVAT